MAVLSKRGVRSVGAGENLAAACARREVAVGGVRVGFLAITTVAPGGYEATSRSAGVAVHPASSPQAWLLDAVRAARRNVDILCVSLHSGIERQSAPAAFQREIAVACVRAGASFVIGHHPHCLQPIEVIDGALVAHSLGNFVGIGTDEFTNRSIVLTARFADGHLEWYEETPIRLENHRPRPDGPTKRTRVPPAAPRPGDTESRG
jgi:poly-gamma-glutamate synthesis protein (capsule biosynthesis protein)